MSKIKTTSITQAVIDRIVSMVATGELKPGQRLPTQQALADDFGVGLSTLREAIQALSLMGLVETRQGSGTYIQEELAGLASRQIEIAMLNGPKGIEQLMEARLIVEGELNALAAQRATAGEIEGLESLCSQMVVAIQQNNIGKWESLDVEFHLKLAEASHNKFLLQMLQSIHQFLELLVQSVPGSQSTIDQHLRLFEAVRDRDSVGARRITHEIVLAGRNMLDLREPDQVDKQLIGK